jgi:GPN-loop GTPase
MLQMDLPHLNVLTKIDKLADYGPLPFNLDFYTEVHDLSHLLPYLNDESPVLGNSKFESLNKAIVELVEDFQLVAYETLAVEDKRSMMNLLQAIDRAGGYAFGSAEGANDTVWQVAVREGMRTMDILDVQERWLDAKDEYDEYDRRNWEREAKAREGQDTNGGSNGADDDELGYTQALSDGGVKVIRR